MKGINAFMDWLEDRLRARLAIWWVILLLVALALIGIALLRRSSLLSTALLYIGIPSTLAFAITLLRAPKPDQPWWHQYRELSLISLIVFLASSMVLSEGFICIAFFLPIYFLVISIVFLCHRFIVTRKRRSGKLMVSILPLLILVSAFEGTTESLSLERVSYTTATRVANLTPDQVMRNLTRPIDLNKRRNWLLSVFPMPYHFDAGSLNPGDIHRIHTRYHRWFVTNTHRGELHLQILEVTPTEVHTRIIHDTTFFSTYLTQIGTRISLNEIAPGQTEITLRFDYRRNLDPAWYFHPLQKYAMSQMAGFFIDEVMIR